MEICHALSSVFRDARRNAIGVVVEGESFEAWLFDHIEVYPGGYVEFKNIKTFRPEAPGNLKSARLKEAVTAVLGECGKQTTRTGNKHLVSYWKGYRYRSRGEVGIPNTHVISTKSLQCHVRMWAVSLIVTHICGVDAMQRAAWRNE